MDGAEYLVESEAVLHGRREFTDQFPGLFADNGGAEDLVRAEDPSGIPERNVLPPEMEPIGAGKQCDIEAIVDEKEGSRSEGEIPDRPRRGKQLSRGHRLLPELHHAGPSGEYAPADLLRGEAATGADGTPAQAGRTSPTAKRQRQEALNHPAVNEALEILGAEIQEIRPTGSETRGTA